jgi:regulator of extracellular matrix RemA (YlzA/DUF370 family)
LNKVRKGIDMEIQLMNIGYGNIIASNRIISLVSPDSSPIKRLIQDARERQQLVDATCGRKTRAVIITDSNHVILSSVLPETIANRFVQHLPTMEAEENE